MLSKISGAVALLMAVVAAGTPRTGAAAPGPVTPPAATQASERTGDIIVQFRAGTTLTSVAGVLDRANAAAQATTSLSRLVLLHPAAGESVDAAVARLRAEPDIAFAEPNTTVHAVTTTPNDPLYATYQWNLGQIGVPTAWDATTGSTAVTVAVLDTGVDGTHPDLAGRMVAGYNFVANNTNAADDYWHGTFVAGIIAANGNNSTGIAGICWTCKIMPVKVLDAQGNGNMFFAAQGIDWAVAHGAKIINMSFGGSSPDAGLQTSINNAWAAGVVLVAATGNSNSAVMYPGAATNVIGVASLSQAGARSSFSNFGPQVALSAPGENISSLSCTCGALSGGYSTASGTSFASPEVAGVAALMVADGTADNATIVNTLKSTATDVDAAGFDNNTGWGRVNAALALGPDITPPTVSIASPAANAVVSGNAAANVTAADNVAIKTVKFWMDGVYQGNDPTAPYSWPWDTTLLANGAHRILVEASDTANNKNWASVNITVSNGDANPPSVSITSPLANATIFGTATANIAASDDSGIKTVKFWMDGVYQGNDPTAPYSWQWDTTLLTNATHRILVEADDVVGNKSWASVNVVVNNDSTPPVVSIASPADGANVSGTVTANTTASDNTGIKTIKFWLDGVYQGNDPTGPYSWQWDTTLLANGTHRILVEASDAGGNKAWAAININVNNP